MHEGSEMKNSDYYTDHLLRLPMYYELTDEDLDYVIDNIKNYFLEVDS
jgi:dTDP-4-amino-4,6-dideoxygalactose transaminase